MGIRAYLRLPKSEILAASLGARTRFARLSGVFSAAKIAAKLPKKRIFLKSLIFTIGYMFLFVMRIGLMVALRIFYIPDICLGIQYRSR